MRSRRRPAGIYERYGESLIARRRKGDDHRSQPPELDRDIRSHFSCRLGFSGGRGFSGAFGCSGDVDVAATGADVRFAVAGGFAGTGGFARAPASFRNGRSSGGTSSRPASAVARASSLLASWTTFTNPSSERRAPSLVTIFCVTSTFPRSTRASVTISLTCARPAMAKRWAWPLVLAISTYLRP